MNRDIILDRLIRSAFAPKFWVRARHSNSRGDPADLADGRKQPCPPKSV